MASRKRVPRRKTRATELTEAQAQELTFGPRGDNETAFKSEAERRQAWRDHAFELAAGWHGTLWGAGNYDA